MHNIRVDLIQDVQDTYASLCGITTLVVDVHGEQITHASAITPLTQLVMKGRYLSFVEDFHSMSSADSALGKAMVFDIYPGLQSIVVPIGISDKHEWFLWAGVLIEEGAHGLVKNYVKERMYSSHIWLEALGQVQETTPDEKQRLKEKLEKMAEMVRTILEADLDREEERKKLALVDQSLTLMSHSQLDIPRLLEQMLELNEEIDFIGLACKKKHHFSIDFIRGVGDKAWLGSEFTVGEGFLGHVVLTGKPKVWRNISRDPRVSFFQRRGIYPDHLFTFPVHLGNEVRAVLFGGGTSIDLLKSDLAEWMNMLVKLIGFRLSQTSLEESVHYTGMRLMSLMEFFHALHSSADVRKLLSMLINAPFYGLDSTFSCIIRFRGDDPTDFQVICRGMSSAEGYRYAEDVLRRFRLTSARTTTSIGRMSIGNLSMGSLAIGKLEGYIHRGEFPVLEYPLGEGDQIDAFLCTSLPREHLTVDEEEFLACLVTMTYLAIRKGNEFEWSKTRDGPVTMLHRAIRQWDGQAFEQTSRARDIALPFMRYLGLEEKLIQDISTACLLSVYHPQYLQESFNDEEWLQILVDYTQWQKNFYEHSQGNESELHSFPSHERIGWQIIVLIFHYLEQGDHPATSERLPGIDLSLSRKFNTFLTEVDVWTDELAPPVPEKQALPKPTPASTLDSSTTKWNSLTSREKEVIKWIVKGLSNQQIAEKLYISNHTVKNHITNIYQKLNVQDRAQAIALFYQLDKE